MSNGRLRLELSDAGSRFRVGDMKGRIPGVDGKGGRAASRPCEGSEPSVRGAGLLAGRVVKGFS